MTAALAAPEVTAADAPVDGGPAERVVRDDADVVLLYASEQRGLVGPCGCDVHPKGGLDRIGAYADAVRATGSPTLLLNAGRWLASEHDGGELDARSLALNTEMHTALRTTRFDALNVTLHDWPDVARGPRPGLVSANLRHPDVPVVRYRVVEAGELTVAITGVSRPGLPYLQPDGLEERPPLDALTALAPEMEDRADLVVVADLVPALAAVPGVDVVVEADHYTARYGPWAESDAVWVRSWNGTSRLGELRLWVEDGRVVRALDRVVDLDF
jgi:hypothetical protein